MVVVYCGTDINTENVSNAMFIIASIATVFILGLLLNHYIVHVSFYFVQVLMCKTYFTGSFKVHIYFRVIKNKWSFEENFLVFFYLNQFLLR